MNKLNLLDLSVFLVCIFATLSVAFIAYKNSKKQKHSLFNYILMGRQITLPIFVATLVSTWYGGIFGVTKIAYESGIYNFITQGVFWYASYLLMAFLLVKKIRKIKAYTLPELVENLFGKKAGKLAAIFNFFNVVPIAYTISLGLILHTIFGGSSFMWMLIGSGFVLLYSSVSGFRAIVYTDILQFFIMCTSVVMVIVFSYFTYGGFDFLSQNLATHYFNISGNEGYLSMMVWGFIALSTLIDPNFYQRIFAAKSDSVAKKGIIISTLVWIVFDLCTTFGAMYAKAAMPDLDSANAYFLFALEILPAGFRGFFIAGILATILSTIDSYLFIAGNTISYDLLGLKQKTKWLHHFSIVFVAVLAIVLAQAFDGNIKAVWKTLGSYSAGSLLLPVVYAFYFKKQIAENYFILMVISSAIAISIWRIYGQTFIEELYIGLFISFVLLLLYNIFGKLNCRKKI